MSIQVRYDVKAGCATNASPVIARRRPATAGSSRGGGRGAGLGLGGGGVNSIGALASMYQKIPGGVLTKMESKQIQNYAILEGNGLPVPAVGARFFDPRGNLPTNRQSVSAKWRTVAVLGDQSLRQVLTSVERENSTNPRTEKIKLNFKDGYQVTFSRINAKDPRSLRYTSEYDPSEAFRGATASKVADSRKVMQKKMQFIVDNRGRALIPNKSNSTTNRPMSADLGGGRPQTASPNRPRSAFNQRAPTPGSASFAFKPVSMLSFAVKPNDQITGCRPGIRDTNPQAIHYRPRALTRNLPPSVAAHADGLVLNDATGIDYRNSVSPFRRR